MNLLDSFLAGFEKKADALRRHLSELSTKSKARALGILSGRSQSRRGKYYPEDFAP
jgi:hypothetical protein